ncbi:MAG: hypothetical protein KDD35_13040 [Bdellovibrionales bacterium]|nr:hypothetical protein [Bdellovibrionales bacterium]
MKGQASIALSLLSLAGSILVISCSSPSVLPDKTELKVSREKPESKCESLGKVAGTSLSTKASPESVLENMKEDAAAKGANYLLVEQYSSTGTAVTGIAYRCP